jgi:hypothetical protein
MKIYRAFTIITVIGLFHLIGTPVFAECNIPNVIANGQVADASKVMDNFTAIAGCVDDGVKPTGTPQEGNVAIFSGAQTVTGGDLTGDVTTSGGTATILSNTGVTPGTYINPNITVDGKGRIVAATNGVGGVGSGEGGGSNWTELNVANPGAETGSGAGWTMSGGGFTASLANPSGHAVTPLMGNYVFVATPNGGPSMSQVIDMSTFATEIDAGNVMTMLEAYATDTYTPGENPYMYIAFRDAAGSRIALAITELPIRSLGAGTWRFMSITGRLPPLTRSIALVLVASRVDGTNNNVAYDGVRAFMRID